MKINVNISEIEKIVSLLLLKLRESKGEIIELNIDYYWDIPVEELYNPYKEPSSITLGQLSFDLERIAWLFNDIDDAIPYDLKRISSILAALNAEDPIAF